MALINLGSKILFADPLEFHNMNRNRVIYVHFQTILMLMMRSLGAQRLLIISQVFRMRSLYFTHDLPDIGSRTPDHGEGKFICYCKIKSVLEFQYSLIPCCWKCRVSGLSTKKGELEMGNYELRVWKILCTKSSERGNVLQPHSDLQRPPQMPDHELF